MEGSGVMDRTDAASVLQGHADALAGAYGGGAIPPIRDALGDAWVQARMPSHRQLAAYLGIGFRAPASGFYAQAGLAAATGLDGEPHRAGEQAVYPVLELGWSYRF